MPNYPDGLIVSRLLTAIGDLENISSSACPDYATFMTDPMKHLRDRVEEAIDGVCQQYNMDSKPILERLDVYQARQQYGEPWFVIRWWGVELFQVNLPFTQIEHWFGDKP